MSEFVPVIVGCIGAPHGIRGWVRINSFTEPHDNLFSYPLMLEAGDAWRPILVEQMRPHGKNFIAKLAKVDDRDQAAMLTNFKLAVNRSDLPVLDNDYYWADIIGLDVYNHDDVFLGKARDFFSAGLGANDVLVVRDNANKDLLIPYVPEMYILDIDLSSRKMRVRWEAGT